MSKLFFFKNNSALLFIFSRKTNEAIHSFFCVLFCVFRPRQRKKEEEERRGSNACTPTPAALKPKLPKLAVQRRLAAPPLRKHCGEPA